MRARSCALVLVVALMSVIVLNGCSAFPSPGAPPTPPLPSPSAAIPTAAEAAAAGQTPTLTASLPPTPTEEPSPDLEMRFSLTAREAYEIALGPARQTHPEYAVYEIIGCQDPLRRAGHHEKTGTILEGECGEWLVIFQRPADRGSYHKLSMWVAPNGIMKTEESARPVGGYGMDRRGDASDWLVDSDHAMEITEAEGGRSFRQEHPTLDVAQFDSRSYAVVYAALSFHPVDHLDEVTESTTEYRGSENAIWVVKYLPMDRLKLLIDAATGEVLLKSVGTGDYD